MSLATKNVATVVLGSVLILALSFAFVTPAKADLLSDLNAQVQALLAQIQALGGGSTASGAGCYAFTMTHQQGDSGGEVMWIQKFLNSHGAQVAVSGAGSPGNETAYFGAMTKAGVAKWQAANGVSPAAGYWGPLTRAKVAGVCASAPTSPTTPTTPTTGGEVLNGTAGSANVTSTSEDVEDEVFTGETEKVLGFKVEASGADVRVTNIRVKFTAGTFDTSASDRLAEYFSDISIWANGQKIASMAPSSFIRDSAGIYSASIPVAQVVRMGGNNKVTFHVGAMANSSIDSDNDGSGNDWKVELVQTRYTDPTGATLFDTTAGISNGTAASAGDGVYVSRLSSSSDVKLRMGEGSGHPKAMNIEVSDDGSTEVTLAEFTLKAEGAAMEFDRLIASTTVTGTTDTSTMVQNFYLMRGTTRLDEVAATAVKGQVVTFSLDDTEEIAMDATQTYKIVAKVNQIGTGSGSGTAFDQGDTITASTSPGITEINAKSSSDGKSVTTRAGSITTYTQSLYSAGIMVTKVGESVSISNNATTPANSFATLKMTVRVKAFGSDDVYIPLNANATTTTQFSTYGLAYKVVRADGTATSSGASATVAKISGGTIVAGSPDLVKIGSDGIVDLELNVSFNPGVEASLANTLKQWRVELVNVGHRATETATVATSNVTAAPAEDFRTSYSPAIDN